MKKIATGIALAALAATAAQAADRPLNNAAIANALAGKTVQMGGGFANFGKDRSYNFSGLFYGKWRATNRSVCVSFQTGGATCSKVVHDGKNVVIVDAQKNRFLVK